MHRLGQTVADEVAVGGLLDAFSPAQSLYLLREEFPVESIGMVEVDALALLGREVGSVVVVGILWDECHTVDGQCFQNLLYYGCLAGTCSAGDAYDVHVG